MLGISGKVVNQNQEKTTASQQKVYSGLDSEQDIVSGLPSAPAQNWFQEILQETTAAIAGYNLVQPLWKRLEFVNWDESSQYMER